jgi:hypothetical protein
MWFVSKQRYEESLRERDGLKDRLLRSMATVRKAELERDQAISSAQVSEQKLAAALQDVSNAELELSRAEEQVAKIRRERDVLQGKLQAIEEIIAGRAHELNGHDTSSRLNGVTLRNGVG